MMDDPFKDIKKLLDLLLAYRYAHKRHAINANSEIQDCTCVLCQRFDNLTEE